MQNKYSKKQLEELYNCEIFKDSGFDNSHLFWTAHGLPLTEDGEDILFTYADGWYREKHKKCQYCKHLKIVVPQINVPSYQLCCAKGKIIRDYLLDMTSVMRICSCYEVDGNRYE